MSQVSATTALALANPLAAQADTVLKQVNSTARDYEKAGKAAKDFESILLTNWLQQAEESFASLPGGDDEAGQDAGTGALSGIAMQSLGQAMTASGGIGLASMIEKQLRKTAQGHQNASAKDEPRGVLINP